MEAYDENQYHKNIRSIKLTGNAKYRVKVRFFNMVTVMCNSFTTV